MKGALKTAVIVAAAFSWSLARAAPALPDTILFGVAYYDEYTPVDRVEEDARMMRAAGINVVRIAESTWGTLERQPGIFDFSHVDRTLTAMRKYGIKVIVGTPTYAVPTWLAQEHPNILAVTPSGRASYGRRQNMDITDPDYRTAAVRVINALVDHVKDDPNVIGYQIDNETKPYETSGPSVQAAFVASLKAKYPNLADLNKAFGLDYWSNRINRWEDFPSVNGSINASLTNAFGQFQRGLVTEFLQWQAKLVRAKARPDQFITHNFDLSWRGYSFGIQGQVDHWEAAKPLDVAGIDIYHPGQDLLSGAEIALGGDVARSMRNGQNYLVLETQAQGFPQWTPYPGQLRLQAFSHIASGANMIEYWHWATTANAFETYWRGLLTQDYRSNATYEEAKTIGADLKRLGPKLVNLRKHNSVAIYVSNQALSAFDAFPLQEGGKEIQYNDVFRSFYDALYRLNVETDIISPSSQLPLNQYKLIIVPAIYAASNADIAKLNDFAKAGGHLLYTFKSGFSDENTKVRYAMQPGEIAKAAGVEYQQFTIPENVSLAGDPFAVGDRDNHARWWMELLNPTTATIVARYKHAAWDGYAAMTRNTYGRGEVTYLGFMPTDGLTEKILADTVKRAGIVDIPHAHFPIIVRRAALSNGHRVKFVFNYSGKRQYLPKNLAIGTELLSGKVLSSDERTELKPWGLLIVEGDG